VARLPGQGYTVADSANDREGNAMLHPTAGIAAAVSVLAGVLICYWGYRIFRVMLGIAGFIAGMWLFYLVGVHFTGHAGVLTIVLMIFGGLIGASLSVAFYFIGVFLIGALGGWHVGLLIAGATGTVFLLVIPIVLAVIGGILAIFFQRLIVTVSTAFIGAWAVVAGGFYLLGSGMPPVELFSRPSQMIATLRGMNPLFVLVWLVLAVTGIVYQYRFPGRRVRGGAGRDEE
jgi:hypothetical protein